MGYSGDGFSTGEQPTTAKWNKLWTNDASFNDGTGIGTNAIAAASLATNAIKLGVATITSDFTTGNASATQITGLTSSVTIPNGNRSVLVICKIPETLHTVADGELFLTLWDGTVGSGTQIGMDYQVKRTSGTQSMGGMTAIAVVTPSAGAKTYNAAFNRGGAGGTAGTTGLSATTAATLLVLAI